MHVAVVASLPGGYEVRLNTRHSHSQTCVSLYVGVRGAGGTWQAVPRVLPCTSEPEKGKAEGLKVCKLQNVLFIAEVASGELELGAKFLLLHVGCSTTLARDFSLNLFLLCKMGLIFSIPGSCGEGQTGHTRKRRSPSFNSKKQ